MVHSNLKRLNYSNFRWFIGVYPNDPATLRIARELQQRYPEKLRVVVTDRDGPTSKAHCLNCILQVLESDVAKAERDGEGWIPHYIGIHDAEDVLHPDALKAINGQASNLDFIQLPIFSLPGPLSSWVAGTYMDEFAEIHLREIPVRQALGMPIPSAGVGTFFSWSILSLMNRRFHYCFDEGNLTEDYEISLRIARLGGKQKFLLARDQRGSIVATREYFPDSLGRSIRQKTRWTTGIALQTMARWGDFGVRGAFSLQNVLTGYALWRDRKSLMANPTVLSAWLLMALAVFASLLYPALASKQGHPYLETLLAVNMGLFAFRLFQRARFCRELYGSAAGILAIPRIAVSTFINGLACMSALGSYMAAGVGKRERKIEWAKTDHRFPTLEEIEGRRIAANE
jgi:bacteriophage N4 adsorption protein B